MSPQFFSFYSLATADSAWQTAAALIIVAIAAVWLICRFWRARQKPGCGDGCGCPTDQFKQNLRK